MRTIRAPRTRILLGIVLTIMGGSRLAIAQILVDTDFNASSDSTALRTNSASQDWYESRQDVPTLLNLDNMNVGGNSTKKAKLTASTSGNAYLTQEFSAPQTQRFSAQWEIYVDSILDRPNSTYDRAALMFIGDDTGTDTTRKGPNAEDSERFVYLAFEKEGGGTSGTMNLVARESTFVTVAIGLSLKQWYTIKVMVDLTTGTYEVYVDGQLQGTVMARTAKSSVTHISFAEWPSSEGAATFYVDNVTAQSSAAGQDSDTDDRAHDVAIQSDGKIVVVGGSIKSHGEFAVARYNTDGSLDTSFGRGGLVTTDLAWGYSTAECVIIQPDGKIIVAGDFDDRSTLDVDFALVRYNADGSLDATFGGDGIVTTNLVTDDTGQRSSDTLSDIALQPDGKIVAVGASHIYAIVGRSPSDFALARYDRFGNLDPTFSGDGKVITPIGTHDAYARSVALRPDGKIVVAGDVWDEVDWDYELALARYNANGLLDRSFTDDGKQIMDISSGDDSVESMVLQPDGKIVLAGSSFDGSRGAFLLARYNADGTRDTSFMGAGIYRMNIGSCGGGASSVARQPDGKIVAAGYTAEFRPPESYDKFDFALTRYNTNGSLDLSFSGDGKVTTNYSVASDLFIAFRWSGPVGTIMKLGAQGYPAEEEIGHAFFDSDRDGVWDAGEPSVILRTSLAGDITYATLTVPSVAPGDYPVQFDVPSGGPVEMYRTFTVTQPSIMALPPSGPLGTPIAVAGFGFIPRSSGSVYLDLNSNGRWDASETKQSVTTNRDGVFTASLTPPYYDMFPFGYKGYFNFVVRTDVPGDDGPNPIYAVFQMVP